MAEQQFCIVNLDMAYKDLGEVGCIGLFLTSQHGPTSGRQKYIGIVMIGRIS